MCSEFFLLCSCYSCTAPICFEPRVPVVVHHVKRFASCVATSGWCTSNIPVCDYEDSCRCEVTENPLPVDPDSFSSRPCIDFSVSSPLCFLPTLGFVRGSASVFFAQPCLFCCSSAQLFFWPFVCSPCYACSSCFSACSPCFASLSCSFACSLCFAFFVLWLFLCFTSFGSSRLWC